MNSIEQAIRTAIAKGDETDQAFRRRIYGSASAALERSLTLRPYTDGEMAKRRDTLIATIRTIESEFLTAVEDVAGPAAVVESLSTAIPLDPVVQPPAVNEIMPAGRNRPSTAKPVKIAAPANWRPWAKYALNIGFLLLLLVGVVWIYGEGERIYAQATSPQPSAQKPMLAESGGTDQPDQIDWIQVFSANDTDLLTSATGATAEITSREGSNFVVMSGDSTHEVAIKIGAGLVQTFAGKRVLLNFKARSINGSILDTGVHCDFGADTKCERKRFKIGPIAAEYMFAVMVAASASGDGALLIAADLANGGGQVEIESIRATIVEPDAG